VAKKHTQKPPISSNFCSKSVHFCKFPASFCAFFAIFYQIYLAYLTQTLQTDPQNPVFTPKTNFPTEITASK